MSGCRKLTNKEISRIANSFTGGNAERNRALFLLGVNSGFRVSELCSLRLDDVIDEFGQIREEIFLDKSRMKGKKQSRSVPINRPAKKILSRWVPILNKKGFMHKNSPLFPATSGRALDRIGAWRVINQAKRKCKLSGKVATHSMRKTFVDNAHEYLLEESAKGKKIDVWLETAEVAGHANPKNTLLYIAGLGKRKRQIVENIGIEVE